MGRRRHRERRQQAVGACAGDGSGDAAAGSVEELDAADAAVAARIALGLGCAGTAGRGHAAGHRELIGGEQNPAARAAARAVPCGTRAVASLPAVGGELPGNVDGGARDQPEEAAAATGRAVRAARHRDSGAARAPRADDAVGRGAPDGSAGPRTIPTLSARRSVATPETAAAADADGGGRRALPGGGRPGRCDDDRAAALDDDRRRVDGEVAGRRGHRRARVDDEGAVDDDHAVEHGVRRDVLRGERALRVARVAIARAGLRHLPGRARAVALLDDVGRPRSVAAGRAGRAAAGAESVAAAVRARLQKESARAARVADIDVVVLTAGPRAGRASAAGAARAAVAARAGGSVSAPAAGRAAAARRSRRAAAARRPGRAAAARRPGRAAAARRPGRTAAARRSGRTAAARRSRPHRRCPPFPPHRRCPTSLKLRRDRWNRLRLLVRSRPPRRRCPPSRPRRRCPSSPLRRRPRSCPKFPLRCPSRPSRPRRRVQPRPWRRRCPSSRRLHRAGTKKTIRSRGRRERR